MLPLYDLIPHSRFPLFTILIIVVNLLVTGWMSAQPEAKQTQIVMKYGFMPARLSHVGRDKAIDVPIIGVRGRRAQPVQIGVAHLSTERSDVYLTFLTTMFLHGGWLHLLTNMWMLWVFGNNVEDRLGHFVFLAFYALGGIIATLVFWVSGATSTIPVVGASGAVAAVLGGYAITFPMAKVRTLIFVGLIFILDIPALALLGLWFVMQVASGLMGLWGMPLEPVAFWSHIGGFVAGMILMPIFGLGAAPPGTDWRKETEEMFRFEDPRFPK